MKSRNRTRYNGFSTSAYSMFFTVILSGYIHAIAVFGFLFGNSSSKYSFFFFLVEFFLRKAQTLINGADIFV